MRTRGLLLFLGLTLATGTAFGQEKPEDMPIPDPAVPQAAPVPTAVNPVKTPPAVPVKPTVNPAAKAPPLPARTLSPTPTPKPTVVATPPLKSTVAATPAATAASPEDIPLPADPAVPAAPPAAGTALNPEDMPLGDPAVPGPSPLPNLTPNAAGKNKAEALPLPGDVHAGHADSHMEWEDEPGNSQENETGGFLSQEFMRLALYSGVLVAIVCSYLGLFVVARRMVFVGVALAEMSSAGIALSLLVEGHALFGVVPHVKPLYGALACMLLGVILFSRRWAPRRVSSDGVIGIFYVAATAASILMIAKSPGGETHMLTLLQGDVLTVNVPETVEMAVAFAIIGLLHLVFAKEFMLVSMDRDTAGTQGLAAAKWDFLIFLTIGVAVALSIRSTGVLMTSSMLILPAATALLVVSRWKQAALLAPALGIIAVVGGLFCSYEMDVPSSAAISAISAAMLLPALVWRTVRQT